MKGRPFLAMPALAGVAAAVWIVMAPPASDWPGLQDTKGVPKQDVAVVDWPSYSRDIQPIFNQYCVDCHGPTRAEQGLRLDSYQATMKGTRYGPVVIPYEPDFSTLVAQIKHQTASELWMPPGDSLSANRIKNIEEWIKVGAENN